MDYEFYYNNFAIGTANHFGRTVYVIRPTEYAEDLYGELGMSYWAEANSLEDAQVIVDNMIVELEREVANG